MPSLTPSWSRYKGGALLLTLNTWKNKNSFRVHSCLFPPYKPTTVVDEYFKSIFKWNIILKRRKAWDKRRTRILITDSGAPGLSNIPADVCPSVVSYTLTKQQTNFKHPTSHLEMDYSEDLKLPVQYLRCSILVLINNLPLPITFTWIIRQLITQKDKSCEKKSIKEIRKKCGDLSPA